ncbi:hypothetical protein [Rodentibacter pneumotropicus]|uniref:hypothetical protein n=1 Tax=Rodentibacter pneumotropicus TaxID=758 RepID=UPI00109C0F22|nr:hypothetical protein [Rodentibacter pneumotropicus]THA09414.1 hypothetical protein D3M77_02045 [Rodentibacter pneumotropicus]
MKNEFSPPTWHITSPIVSFDYDQNIGSLRITYKALSPNPHLDTFAVEISPSALPELLSLFHQLEKEQAENIATKAKEYSVQ